MFRWMLRPQLAALFLAACFFVSAWGLFARSQALPALAHAPMPLTKSAAIVAPAPPPAVDCTTLPCLALTFDDGPDPSVTPGILDILARQQVHATFFLVGREVPGREPLVQRMYQEGNEIGNHSWNHLDFTTLSPAAMQQEWQSTEAAIVRAGVPAPRIFRPPYGAVNAAVRMHVPLTIVRWDADTEDWMTRDAGKISERLLHDAHPGGIVLMHDKYYATRDMLEPAIIALKQHYNLVTVSQLLSLQPGDQGQYFNR